MVAQPASVLITADEFDMLPEPDDGSRLELVHGEVVRMMTVTWEHGELQAEIASRLREFVRKHQLGGVTVETGFRLHRREGEPHIVRSPDVAFVAKDRLPPARERSRGSLPISPDLAVEVASPDERDAVLQQKVSNYLAAGVGRVWVVRPATRDVTVYRTGGEAHLYQSGATLTSEDAGFAVAGFELALREVFAQP